MSTNAQGQKRLAFVDSLRGLAVVFMVPLHTSHGWVRPDARTGELWHASQFFGGLAAPIFLTLTGVSLGLQWANQHARGQTPNFLRDAGRGLQIVVLGYLLRLQMWVIDAGGYAQPRTYPAQLLLLAAYGLAYHSFGRLARARNARAENAAPLPRASVLALAALAAWALGLYLVSLQAPDRARSLLRVDVLQCIGVSLIVLSTLAALRGKRFASIATYLAAGLICALLTAPFWQIMPGPLPEPLAAYLAQWTPANGRPVMGLFPLFPWTAYALAGAALGLHWGRAASMPQLEISVIAWVAGGAFIALLCSESWPPAYDIARAHAWLVLPLRVAYKLGLVLVLFGVALADRPIAGRNVPSVLVVLGRASLLVYWVHLEFAFGAASRPFSRRLDLLGWGIGSAILLCAMWLMAYVRVVGPRQLFRPHPLPSS